MPKPRVVVVLCFMLVAMSTTVWCEALDRNQIDAAVNASLDALKTGSLSFDYSQTRPADNVTALGAGEIQSNQGGKVVAGHDVILPGKGTLEWNQEKFITSLTEAHVNQGDHKTMIFNHQFAWDGTRLTSLSSKAASVHNALEEDVSDLQIVEGTEKIKGEVLNERAVAMIMFDPIVWVLERSHIAGPEGPILSADYSVEAQGDGTILVKTGITQMILDPKQGHLPVQITHSSPQSSQVSVTKVTYKELPGSVWFPISVVKEQTEQGKLLNSAELKVTNYSLEPPKTNFTIDFPSGVQVDERLSSAKDIDKN